MSGFQILSEQITIIRAVGDIIAAIVAREFGITGNNVFARTRGSSAEVTARQTTIYLMHILFQCSYTHIGKAVRRDRSTVRYACHVIEDFRDDPVFDEKLTMLEGKIAFLAQARLI